MKTLSFVGDKKGLLQFLDTEKQLFLNEVTFPEVELPDEPFYESADENDPEE